MLPVRCAIAQCARGISRQQFQIISCPLAKVAYICLCCRGGFYEIYLNAAQNINKPAPAGATDATGHNITR